MEAAEARGTARIIAKGTARITAKGTAPIIAKVTEDRRKATNGMRLGTVLPSIGAATVVGGFSGMA